MAAVQEMAIWNLDHGEEEVLGPRSLAFVHGGWATKALFTELKDSSAWRSEATSLRRYALWSPPQLENPILSTRAVRAQVIVANMVVMFVQFQAEEA